MSRVPTLVARVALVVALAVVAACEPTLSQETGLVVAVRQSSLTSVEGFQLRTADGRTVDFSTTGTRFDQAFPVQHLGEHLALAQPITVTYRVVDGRNQVVKLADAPTR
ncbi:MAG: hypothetical protein R3C32_00140 [Chloroflexota bacterium]